MNRETLFPIVIALGLGVLVLMVNGLPPIWGMLVLGGLLLPGAALLVSAPGRFLEICLMLSFGFAIDVHLARDPAHEVDPGGFPVSLTGLITCALTVLWLFKRVRERQNQSPVGGMKIPLLGLWTASSCSVMVSSEPRFGLFSLINIAYFALMFLYLVNNITTRERLQSLLGWLMLAIGITSVAAIGEYLFGHTEALTVLGMVREERLQKVIDTDVMRVGGLMGSSNALATVLVQMLPLMLAFFINPKSGYRKPLLLAGLGLGVVALILTYSRGGWLAFVLVLMILIPVMGSHRFGVGTGGWVKKGIILAAIFAALAAPFYGMVYTRLTQDDHGSAYSRLPMMEVAMRMIEDHPLFGVGLGNYELVMDQYDQTPERAHRDFRWPVHNIYLNITAEVGIVGGLWFLLACLVAVWEGLRAMRTSDLFLRATAIGLLAGLAGFLIIGMKELGPLGSSLYRWFWLAAGLLVATRRIVVAQEAVEQAKAWNGRPKTQDPRPKTANRRRRVVRRPQPLGLGSQ